MANLITNRLFINGNKEQIAEVRNVIKGDEEGIFIDFNKIVPIPKELVNTSYPMKIISQKKYDKQEELRAKGVLNNVIQENYLTKKLSDKYIKDFGYNNWWDWKMDNWGTKCVWDDQIEHSQREIEFQTPYEAPLTVIEKLSEMFPDFGFIIQYADEQLGYNVGELEYWGGDVIARDEPSNGSVEALDMSLSIIDIEDQYYNDYLIDDVTNQLSEFDKNLCLIVHNKGLLNDDYPQIVLEYLLKLSIDFRQTNRACDIIELIKAKNLA